MPRVAKEAPDGDVWVIRNEYELNIVTIEIWDGYGYVPVYNNNGQPFDFEKEVRSLRTKGQLMSFANRVYEGGR